LNPAPHSSRARREQYDETVTAPLQSQILAGGEIRAKRMSADRKEPNPPVAIKGGYGSLAARSP